MDTSHADPAQLLIEQAERNGKYVLGISKTFRTELPIVTPIVKQVYSLMRSGRIKEAHIGTPAISPNKGYLVDIFLESPIPLLEDAPCVLPLKTLGWLMTLHIIDDKVYPFEQIRAKLTNEIDPIINDERAYAIRLLRRYWNEIWENNKEISDLVEFIGKVEQGIEELSIIEIQKKLEKM